MVLTLQTIGYIITQIGSNFQIEFKVEEYKDYMGKEESITANQPSSELRNKKLEELTNEWIKCLKHENGVEGKLVHIVSLKKNTLEHWRAVSFTCGNKILSIYPDGGFINEWHIARQPNGEYFTKDNVTCNTKIYLFRNKDIKFDIQIVTIE